MELTVTDNFSFCELNENEMMMVDGGNMGTAMAAFGGAIAIAWFPVLACACPPAAVVVAAGSAIVGAGIYCGIKGY